MFNLSPVPVPDLSGRVVLVTGAGKGIGAELVRILVAKGAKVFAGIYPGEAAEALPAAAVVLALDVTKQADVDAAVARVQAESGRLDVLVNNAGVIAPIGPLDAVPSDALGAATTPMEGWTVYCSTKAGMRMLTQMMAMELAPAVKTFFVGIPPTDTAMQGTIRQAGFNPISKIPQDKLVRTSVPASVMAWMCGPHARDVEEVLLDVRQEIFTKMMDLPA